MKGVDFDRTGRKRSASLLEQKLSHGRILGQANCPVESTGGLRGFLEPLQEVSENCPVGTDRFSRESIVGSSE
jgi:hypothetical protein